MPYERLDKLIASMGQYSRKDVKKLVRDGLVAVDGAAVKSADLKCDPSVQVITVNGQVFSYEKDVYLMLNKPAGVVTATKDSINQTVMDLLPSEYRGRELFPVGRLDKDTEGLLLITNDGELSHRLLSPGRHVDKEYLVSVEGPLDETIVNAFADGVQLSDGSLCMPATLKILDTCVKKSPETGADLEREVVVTCADVVIQEGMYHQIKRMFGVFQRPVLSLKRIRMGSLKLDETLKPGMVRALTAEELGALKSQAQNNSR